MFRIFCLLSVSVPYGLYAIWGNIEIGVSPPRHEFSIGTGKTVIREIKVFNNSTTDTYTIRLSSWDCVADSSNGTPICRNYTGTGSDPKSLSSWMRFERDGRLSIGPKMERVIKVAFIAPANALPGWHYGIIYFTPDAWIGGSTVTMVRQLWVIFQVNVPGKLIYGIDLWEVAIETPFFSAPDPLRAFWRKPEDRKNWTGALKYIQTELNPFWNKPELVNTGDFRVHFSIPVTNSGNVDVRPIGRIELYDEDNTILRKIGKESIKTPDGVYLGEKIVDYLPINDEGGSVLPDGDRKRVYTVDWKWFAYETVEDGKMVVKFQTPGEYYSALSAENATTLYPWEKLKISIATRHIKAKIALEYSGEGGKTVPMELERDITVQYNFIDKVLNWWVILLTGLIIMIAWMIIRRRDSRIEELEDETEELEWELDELEHAKKAAKKILADKKTPPLKTSVQKKTATKKASPKGGTTITESSETHEVLLKPRTPRAKKTPVNP